jgi:rubrerythrin
MLTEQGRLPTATEDGNPVFHAAGAEAVGEYACAECGYGVTVRRALPTCPMCGGAVWEPAGSSLLSPFSRGRR